MILKKKCLLPLLCLICICAFCLYGSLSSYAAENIPKIQYELCEINTGWTDIRENNAILRVTKDRYATAMRISLADLPSGQTTDKGLIRYQVYLSGLGWLQETGNGRISGINGGVRPIESLRVQLPSSLQSSYTLWYSVFQGGQWTDWAKDGQEAGAAGSGQGIEGLRIDLLKPGMEPSRGRVLDPNKPTVALSFDDGPRHDSSMRILDSLEKYGVEASFFLLGNNVVKHGNDEVIRRIQTLGCDLANHSYMHADMSKQSPADISDTLHRTSDAVQKISGQPTRLLRPPYGSFNQKVRETVKKEGYPIILWSLDTLDWKTKNADNTVNEVMSKVKDGDVILMHSIYFETADAVERLIPMLQERGFQLTSVSRLAELRGVTLEAGKVYGRFPPGKSN